MTSLTDEARIRRRNEFLEGANGHLFHVVTNVAKEVPMREIAALIDADDETGAFEVSAAPRAAIAELVRARPVREDERDARDTLLASLGKYEHGFLPCVFLVKLPGGIIEVSVVALRMEVLN